MLDCTYQSDWGLRPYVEMLDAHVRGLMQETRAAMLSMCTYIVSEVHKPDFDYRWEEHAGLVGGSLFSVDQYWFLV